MSYNDLRQKIDLTKVPLAFAEGCTLKKAAYWNNGQILEAGCVIDDEILSEYSDVAIYVPTSLRVTTTIEAVQKTVLHNIEDYKTRQKNEAVRERAKSYEQGAVIFEQGDAEDQDCYFLVEGAVDVVVDGNKVASIRDLGMPIGEMSFVTGEPRSASIIASVPSKLVNVRRSEMKHLMRTNPNLMKSLLDALVKRLRETTHKLSDTAKIVHEAIAGGPEQLESVRKDLLATQGKLTAFATHTERQLGIRKGDLDILDRLLAYFHAKSAEPEGDLAEILGLLEAYRAYSAGWGISKNAASVFEYERMPESLRRILEADSD